MASLLHHNSGILVPRAEYEELTEALATVFRIGARFTPSLIERLDLIDGDPDDEPGGDDEPLRANGDSDDVAWIEWQTMRGSRKPGPNIIQGEEDDEEDDSPEEDDPHGQCDEDGINTAIGLTLGEHGPGCAYSDTGIADSGGLQDAHGVDGDRWLTWDTDQTRIKSVPGYDRDSRA